MFSGILYNVFFSFEGNETFFVSSKILERDNFSIYSGQCGEHVTIKVIWGLTSGLD